MALMKNNNDKDILLQTLELEASLLEQLQLEKQISKYKYRKYDDNGYNNNNYNNNVTLITPRDDDKSKHTIYVNHSPQRYQRKSFTPKHNRKRFNNNSNDTLLKRSHSVPVFSTNSASIIQKKRNEQQLPKFDTQFDTLGCNAKRFNTVTHQLAVSINPGSPKARRSPNATFGFDFGRDGGGSQRGLLIDLNTKQEIGTIYRAHDVGQMPTLEGPVMLPSSIGHQVEGYPGRSNSPKAIFRKASKATDRKMYLSKALAEIESSDRDDIPGPGSYEIQKRTAIGKQILSRFKNGPSVSFQSSAPTGRDPIYSGDHRQHLTPTPQQYGAKPFNKNGIFVSSQMLKAPTSVVNSGKGVSFIKDARQTVPIREPRLLSKGFLEMVRGKDVSKNRFCHTEFGGGKRTAELCQTLVG